MIKPITNHIHPITVEELETIHAHVNGTFAPSSIAKEREAYTSGQEVSANLFELVAAAMPERNPKVLCNIDLSAPIEQLQAEIAALRVWAYREDETAHQQADMIPALAGATHYAHGHAITAEQLTRCLAVALEVALEWIDAVPADLLLPEMPDFDRHEVDYLLAMSRTPDAPEEPAPAGNFLIKFIAGNPEIFSEIRTSRHSPSTLEDAMSELSTIDSHGWRGWIEDKDGNRVKETTTETLWAAKNEQL